MGRRLSGADIFGHPRGIFTLCLVEMWERFSFYGMRALLLLYLIDRLGISDVRAALVYGAYTSMVYGFCVIGGWIADRYVGQWRSIALGGAMILGGHLGLAVQDQAGLEPRLAEVILFIALALIIAGTGLFKPSSTALVGQLYPPDDQRRTTGFHIFYFGINFGAAIAAVICGMLAARFGWGVGLGAAAGGMAIGLVLLFAGSASLTVVALPAPVPSLATLLMPLAMVFAAFILINHPDAVGIVLAGALVAALVGIGRYLHRQARPGERQRVAAALALIGAAAIFWSLSEQAGSSLTLFADRIVDRNIGGLMIGAPQLQSFSPALILLLTPVFAWLWRELARREVEPGVAAKHVVGLAMAGAGFAVLWVGVAAKAPGNPVPVGWLALSYLLQVIGEICLAPTAYGAITRLAPPPLAALLTGLWLFSIAIGNFIGARVATLVGRIEPSTGGPAELARYQDVFLGVALVALLAAIVLALFAPRLERWMRA
jgi:POT family proton-dependent oligopeptide transporter